MTIDSIADRLRQLVGSGSTNAFAKKCELPATSIRQYLDGSIPGADKAAQIAERNDVSLLWLVTGQGPMRPANVPGYSGPVLYEDAIRQIVETVVDWLNEEQLELDGDKFWQVVMILYRGTVGEGADARPEGVVNLAAYRDLVKMAARGGGR